MFAYCNNNPVMGYDPTGEYCVANKDGTDTNYLDDWLIEGAGVSGGSIGGGFGGNGNGILAHNMCTANTLPQNGTRLNSSDALDLAGNFLGNGYNEVSHGRFVSADGLRQVRMQNSDILGLHAGGPHINFDILYPTYKSVHVYIVDI